MHLPRYAYNAPEELRTDMLELWRDSRREVYDVAPTNGDFRNSAFQTTAYRVDNTVFSRTRGRNLLMSRHKRHLHGEACGFVRLKFVRGTQYVKSGDGERVCSSANTLSIVDFSRTVDMAVKEAYELGAYLPHAMIGYRPSVMPAHINIGIDSATGRILQSVMVSTFDALPNAGFQDAAAIAAGFSGLIRGLLDGATLSESESPLRGARARSMRDFLERRLRQPDLDATTLQHAFGASRATIFRDFADYGGVSRYIRARRLERAFADLAENAPTHGAVTRAAERWGFASVGQFSRNFRKHFGFAPGAAVGARADRRSPGNGEGYGGRALQDGIDGDPACLEHWLSHLGSQ